MNMPFSTILDLAIILLLVPTIVYAVILNRRLSALRKSRDELAKAVSSFNEATMRAEAGIPKIKKATHEANAALQERVERHRVRGALEAREQVLGQGIHVELHTAVEDCITAGTSNDARDKYFLFI